jgi:hypothetical protein
LLQGIGAQAFDPDDEGELLAAPRLIPGQNRRRVREKGIAAGTEGGGIETESRAILAQGEPARVERAQAGGKCVGREIEEGRSGAAAQVLVTATD